MSHNHSSFYPLMRYWYVYTPYHEPKTYAPRLELRVYCGFDRNGLARGGPARFLLTKEMSMKVELRLQA